MKTKAEIELLKKLSQSAAAWVVDLSTRTFRDSDCPRNDDGSYNAQDVFAWLRKQAEAADADLGGGDSPNLERYRAAKAELAEMEAAERRRTLLPRDQVRSGLLQWAMIIRRLGEQLGKRYGREAAIMLNDSLAECKRVLDQNFGDGSDDENE